MEQENADAQFDVVEQEDVTSSDNFDNDINSDEEVITLPKSKFVKIQRKAKAYDAKKDEPRKSTNRSDEDWKERMELKVAGYNDEEVSLLMKNGGREALKDPYMTAAIETVRTQKKAEAAILGDEGQKSGGTQGNLSPEAFAKLSSDDQLKILSGLK